MSYVWDGPLVDRWGEGYFLGLDFSQNNFEGLTSVKVGLDPSAGYGLVELLGDPDLNGVFKITDKEHQKFVVEQTDGVFTYRQEWDLYALELLAPEPIAPITSLAVPTSATDVIDGTDYEASNITAAELQSNIVFTYNSSTNNFAVTGTLIEQDFESTLYKIYGDTGYWLALDMSQFNSSFTDSTHVDLISVEAFDSGGGGWGSLFYEIADGSGAPDIDPYATMQVKPGDSTVVIDHLVITQHRTDGERLEQTIDISGLTFN